MTKHSIVVVGGGIGGLTALIALRRAGLDAHLFEQKDAIRPIGSGISLSAPPMWVLSELGVDLDAIGVPVDLDFARADGTTRTGVISSPELERDFGASVWSMLRPTLHEALLDLIPTSSRSSGRRVTRVDDTGTHVDVTFDDGSTHTADLVIGADGIHSVIRDQLWGRAPLRSHGLVAWQGWCDYAGRPEREGRIMHNRHAQVGHLPLRLADGRLGRQWWYIERVHPGTGPGAGLEHVLAEIWSGGWDPFIAECVASTDPDVLIRREIQDKRPLPRWSRGRVTLLGDAAHATSPYAGYGAGMAIEDGWQLAKILRDVDLDRTEEVAAALRSYDDLRRGHTTQTVQFARALGAIFHSRNPLVQTLRDTAMDRTPVGGWGLRMGYLDGLKKEMERL
ncbi:NAD(P)/FAD-dependent oxidoreductase [Aeromicrobium sp. NPDC092404]|uniref:FAD-dependent oxidoreductase n=1 Tax=Aeromicrobium sp. NPDC092404 TaxID=3154976 RepID=UPI0034239708